MEALPDQLVAGDEVLRELDQRVAAGRGLDERHDQGERRGRLVDVLGGSDDAVAFAVLADVAEVLDGDAERLRRDLTGTVAVGDTERQDGLDALVVEHAHEAADDVQLVLGQFEVGGHFRTFS